MWLLNFSRWLEMVVCGFRWLQVVPAFSNYAPSKLNIKPMRRLLKIAEHAFKFCRLKRRDYIISFQSS